MGKGFEMNTKIAVFIGAGFVTASLALAGPAEAAGGHATPGHPVGGVGESSAHGGMQPTSLSVDQVNTSVTQVHEWTNFVG
jgi:hypothetical protein